jgi:hypothetical protein
MQNLTRESSSFHKLRIHSFHSQVIYQYRSKRTQPYLLGIVNLAETGLLRHVFALGRFGSSRRATGLSSVGSLIAMSVQVPFLSNQGSHVTGKQELTSSSASSSPASASSSSRSFASTSLSSSPSTSSSSSASSGCSVLRFLALGAVVLSIGPLTRYTYPATSRARGAQSRACTYQVQHPPPLQPPLPQHRRRRRFH